MLDNYFRIKFGLNFKIGKFVMHPVYIVNGQSNCIGSINDVDYDPFMRSYTNRFGWNDIRYTQPSQWAPRMAKNIIEKHKIPVAIFNEAMGGVTESYFLKDKNNIYNGNYGILYKRLEEAEVAKQVKAILWWQGESDGWETLPEVFKSQFQELHKAWMQDYNNPQVYLFQIRFRSCTHINPVIMEAQRQLASEIKDLKIMSTNAAQSDSCHFLYINGYDSLGNRLYRMVAAFNYGLSNTNIFPPDIDKAWFSAPNEITIRMKNMSGNLKIIGKPWADFETTGKKVGIIDGTVTSNFIKLKLGGDSTGIRGISYLSHITPYNDWIVNTSGVGILSFYDVPVLSNIKIEDKNNQTESAFDVFPSIATHQISVKKSNEYSEKANIEIYNILGHNFLSKTFEKNDDKILIDIQTLPKGHYFVLITEGGKKNITKRFLKI